MTKSFQVKNLKDLQDLVLCIASSEGFRQNIKDGSNFTVTINKKKRVINISDIIYFSALGIKALTLGDEDAMGKLLSTIGMTEKEISEVHNGRKSL